MVETNSTDEEKATGRPITGRAERRESPPREYVGKLMNKETLKRWECSAPGTEEFVLILQMRKEYVTYQLSLDHLSLFCDTTGTPGKLPTTTSRGTATSGSKVCRHRLKYFNNKNRFKWENTDRVSGNNWLKQHDGIVLHVGDWGRIISSFNTCSVIFCFVTFITEEKKSTLQDMASQRGVACRAQGWKIHLCAAQLRQLVSVLLPDCITPQHCCVNDAPRLRKGNVDPYFCMIIVQFWCLLRVNDLTSRILWQLDLADKLLIFRSSDKFGAWCVQSTLQPSRRPYS